VSHKRAIKAISGDWQLFSLFSCYCLIQQMPSVLPNCRMYYPTIMRKNFESERKVVAAVLFSGIY
jgi:hypothetical protein